MHRYVGEMRYSTHNSGRYGQPIRADLNVSFSPGMFSVRLGDLNAQTTHSLTNKRFNYQSRDSPVDLLARANGELGGLADSPERSIYSVLVSAAFQSH